MFVRIFSLPKIMHNFFRAEHVKRFFMLLLEMLSAIFLLLVMLRLVFARIFRELTLIFREFAKIFTDFPQICRDFRQITNFSGCGCTPVSYTTGFCKMGWTMAACTGGVTVGVPQTLKSFHFLKM